MIRLDIKVPEKDLETSVPPMTLQMLIENAIKHNIISSQKPLIIKIYSENNSIIIENNIQAKMEEGASTGIGIENIKKRYGLLIGKPLIFENTGEIYRVILPLIKNKTE